jgi:hypothetical protein
MCVRVCVRGAYDCSGARWQDLGSGVVGEREGP